MQVSWAKTLSNVTNARDLYHCNAIELRINWRDYEATQNAFVWTDIDASVNNILNTARGNMNLMVRINLQGKPNWARPNTMGGSLTTDRFMADQSGSMYVAPVGFVSPDVDYNRVGFSYANDNSRSLMATAYRNAISHITSYIRTNLASRLGNLIEVTPVVNYFEETEYPWMPVDRGVDYSSSAISKFQAFLERKYSTIGALNSEWTHPDVPNNSATFASFSQVNPTAYNWNLDPATVALNIKG